MQWLNKAAKEVFVLVLVNGALEFLQGRLVFRGRGRQKVGCDVVNCLLADHLFIALLLRWHVFGSNGESNEL
ncbi:hypothetical protein P3T76_015588 [Phytophthora citrophthora]|uniref:Uncharacterized protein n=1 Tax=Phytophthora citrophthora TaxID=4793 RepID=A0AAD9FZP9_9STRA|nr:hypothetical protein P3T76_015588 [Phytophthora citrophthora]